MDRQHRIASQVVTRIQERTAFNKFNAPELLSQLIAVLEKEELDDAVKAVREVSRTVNEAWRHRDRMASRPGPHWNPWPSRKATLDGEIEMMEFYLKNEDLFYENYDDADEYDYNNLHRLVHALKHRNQHEAKRWADKVTRSLPRLLSNAVWAYVLDGQEAI